MTWEGLQFVHHSMALVNRELCRVLVDSPRIELTLVAPDATLDRTPGDAGSDALAARMERPAAGATDVHVRHEWPPNLEPPTEGRWVMIQPWEYGSLPKAWIEPMNRQVDEVWVPSRYVRDCYVRSGVDSSRVVVIPNGVDPEAFHPGAPPFQFPTQKRFKLLFVGGTLTRKGADILLDTYLATFSPTDDVCLVVKDFGTGSFYRGLGLGERVRALRADPRNAEILYLDAMLPRALMPALYTASDCLVHPYRGEGFGLPIAEAMACGLPVVVPEHGACLDFCDPSVAYLVPAARVELPDARVGDLETVGRGWWAEVDRDALGCAMREVVERREQAREVGRRASARIRRRFTWERAGALVLERLAALAARPIRRFERESGVPTSQR